ncbi:GntR family transcriptional regulator [Variovorax sp. HJSM1_2]|uniref:GntR family transcriptional regulator n=1 Tax=Variovorax sp. HJSM1_2 TaxID=3366263 RepID=UPI003BBCB0B9
MARPAPTPTPLSHKAAASPGNDGHADTREEARVQQRLADAIYEHRLPPGTKLPEIDLCRLLGTSRGTLRKVLDRLASEQVVEQIPNRGAFVARPSVEATRDVYALRRILEAGVVRTLSKRSCGPWIDEVRQQVSEEREANRVGDTGRYIRLAGKFHLDLAAATGNTALNQHLKRVVAQTSLMTALYDEPGTNNCSVLEHLEILDAIQSGQHQEAERLMEEHLNRCERQLRLDDEPKPVDLSQALGLSTEAPPKNSPVPSPTR